MKQIESFHRFYGILKRGFQFATRELGEDFKADVVSQFTDSRTTHLHEMTQEEYDRMCDHLESTILIRPGRTASEGLRHQRSITLHLMQQMGIDTADWSNINAFCRDTRIMGKEFRQISEEEHKALQRKLRAIARNSDYCRRRNRRIKAAEKAAEKAKAKKTKAKAHPLNWVGTLIIEAEADPDTLS